VLYPVSYTQDVFNLIVADMVAVTETQYHGQQCPNADCSVHYHEEPNPDYAEAQADLTAAIARRDDWNIMVVPRSNDYVNAVNEYNNTPAAGQPYAQQRVDSTYALFVQAVNNWSSVFGIWGLNIDGQLGANMQARLNREVAAAETARNNTPETIRTPYYTCDHLHTLHSFGLNFYTAEQVMQDQKSAAKMKDTEGKVKSFDFVTPMRTITRHEDINAYLHQQIAKRIERPFDEMPKFRIGDFTVSVELRPGEMDQAMLAVKGQRDPSYSIPLGSAANADNWQRIVNFLDGSIEKAIEDSNAKITKLETDLKQAQELVGVPFDREEELLKAKIDFAELEARLSGLSEQQDAIIDPEETDEEETAEERAEREAYQNADDNDYPMILDDNAPRHGPRR